jgi:UDP-galactopyranose mutase
MEPLQNILVVGAGLAGSVVARELADNGYSVTVIDKREHIGGNCFDFESNGVRVHKYGPHIFHTNNGKVVEWLSKFTEWIEYKHKVKAFYDNKFITLPPNNETKQILGDKLFDVVYAPYTKKMWGSLDVDRSVLDRIKVRDDLNEYYFPDCQYQYLPSNGYTKMFESILNHPNIKVKLETNFDKHMESDYNKVFSSMPIDQYYDYCYGVLPYRSIKFHNTTNHFEMPTPVVNFTDENKYTRITKWEMFPNHGSGQLYTLEEPCDYKDNNMERYYPVKDVAGKNKVVYSAYKEIPNDKVIFIGRCGMYVYLDMDMAVATSLATVKNFIKRDVE